MTPQQAAEAMREAAASYLDAESEEYRKLSQPDVTDTAIANVLGHKAKAIRAIDIEEVLK